MDLEDDSEEETFGRKECEAIGDHIGRAVAALSDFMDGTPIAWVLVMTSENKNRLYTVGNLVPDKTRAFCRDVLSYFRHRCFRTGPRPRHNGGSLEVGVYEELLHYVGDCVGERRIAWYFAAKAEDGDMCAWCNFEHSAPLIWFAESVCKHHNPPGALEHDLRAIDVPRAVPMSEAEIQADRDAWPRCKRCGQGSNGRVFCPACADLVFSPSHVK